MRKAIFAYNHADWYVDSVVLRARLIAGIPGDLVGSLTGLTDGRFPVAARTRYADDLAERRGRGRGIDLYTRRGAPAIAVADGVVKKIGRDRRGKPSSCSRTATATGSSYRDLGSVARRYPVLKGEPVHRPARRFGGRGTGHGGRGTGDGERPPDAPATGALLPITALASAPLVALANLGSEAPVPRPPSPDLSPSPVTAKQRLFAHPARPGARRHGGEDQLLDAGQGEPFTTYRNEFAGALSLDADEVELRRLRRGSRVLAGTILGRVGPRKGRRAPYLRFEIRPAGRGAPSIDPKPILDGWKLLESTAIYRASGKNVLYGDDADGFSIGQIMLLPKPMLEKRVLADERIDIYPCGRRDVAHGSDRPAGARHARVPGRVRSEADRHLAQVWPRLLHRVRQRVAPLVRARGRHRTGQRRASTRPPGAGRRHRPDRAPADVAPGHDAPRPDHLPARPGREHARDGRSRRPRPRRLAPPVRREPAPGTPGARSPRAAASGTT